MKFLSRDTKAKRAYRPSFDHCEERVVMTLPGLGVVAKNMVGSMSRALVDHGKDQLAGQVFGAVLGVFGIDDGSNQLEFDRINEKLDTIQVDINTIKDDVASLKDSAAIAALDSITKQLKLATIDSLWRDFEALEENMASNPKRDKSIPPTNSVETAALATRITNELHSIVDTFSHAWLGKPSQALGVTLNKPLMKAFSDVLVGRVGVSKTNTAPSTPFLTSKYSQEMIQAFNYFYDEEARAIFLLTNAYNRNGETTLGRSTQIRFPTDAPAVGTAEQQKTAKDHYAAIVATMPQFAIPSWMIIDTRGAHLGWSQFDGLNVGPYSSKNVMRSYLSGSAGQYKYIPATSNAAAKLAHDAEVASGIPFGDLVWHTPTSAQTRDLTKGYSGNATSYLTSHGFNANVYTYQVWTSDIERKPAYLNNTTYYDTYSTEVSTVAGTDNKWFYFPDNAPNSTNVKKYTGGGVLSIYYVTNTHGRFWV